MKTTAAWTAVALSLAASSDLVSASTADRVLLSRVHTLTFRHGHRTSGRRVAPVTQLKCVGGDAKGLYKVETLRCSNQNYGSKHVHPEDDVEWTCHAPLPPEFKLGTTDVICEGYHSATDPYVLRGSCGVEYRLMLTPRGEKRYGHLAASHDAHKSKQPAAASPPYVANPAQYAEKQQQEHQQHAQEQYLKQHAFQQPMYSQQQQMGAAPAAKSPAAPAQAHHYDHDVHDLGHGHEHDHDHRADHGYGHEHERDHHHGHGHDAGHAYDHLYDHSYGHGHEHDHAASLEHDYHHYAHEHGYEHGHEHDHDHDHDLYDDEDEEEDIHDAHGHHVPNHHDEAHHHARIIDEADAHDESDFEHEYDDEYDTGSFAVACIFWGSFLSVGAWILWAAYRAWTRGGRPHVPMTPGTWAALTPRSIPNQGANGGDGPSRGDPAPPYGYNNGKDKSQKSPRFGSWAPAAWTGALGGAAAGMAAASNWGRPRTPGATTTTAPAPVVQETTEGSSTAMPATSSARYEGRGFGTTQRR